MTNLTVTTAVCHNCKGRRVVASRIEGEMRCPTCGGHGRLPVDGHVYWFYRPMGFWGDGHPKYGEQRIACVQNNRFEDGSDPSCWRVTIYAPCGPLGHTIENRPFAEVRHYYYSPTAARLIDHWSRRPTWESGMRQSNWVDAENALRRAGFNWTTLEHLWPLPLTMRLDAARYLLARGPR